MTLQTLAARLGVSRSTVSNAFNRPDQLSDALRTRILDAADQLGYAGPDPAARSLRSGRVGAIGLVQATLRYVIEDAANRLFLDGVVDVCEQEGLAIVLIPAGPGGGPLPDGHHGRPDALRTALVDGVILHCSANLAERRRVLADRRLPVVILDGQPLGDDLFVGVDDEGGGAAAAGHVLALGHRRLAVLSLDRAGGGMRAGVAQGRQRGYDRALAAAGIPASDVPVRPAAGLDVTEFTALVRGLLAGADRPTAILAMSDELAAGAVRVAHAMGLRVPHDLSVVGFDDSATAFAVEPPLTTVRQDFTRKGRLAVRMLLGDVSEGRQVVLPVELVVRGSTGPAPA